MKRLVIICISLLCSLLFVGCNISTENLPQKVDITLTIYEDNNLTKCLVREELSKTIKSLVLTVKERLTIEDIEAVVKSVCFKYGITDIICSFTDFKGGIQIIIGDRENSLGEYFFDVLIS